MSIGVSAFASTFSYQSLDTEINPVNIIQEPATLPVGTILFLKSTKDIYAKNFKAGDHFFVELDKDVTQKREGANSKRYYGTNGSTGVRK